jgi:hypothetical protein
LLSGLEISELTFCGVLASASTFRLDSDYYKKEYLLAAERIKTALNHSKRLSLSV